MDNQPDIITAISRALQHELRVKFKGYKVKLLPFYFDDVGLRGDIITVIGTEHAEHMGVDVLIMPDGVSVQGALYIDNLPVPYEDPKFVDTIVGRLIVALETSRPLLPN